MAVAYPQLVAYMGQQGLPLDPCMFPLFPFYNQTLLNNSVNSSASTSQSEVQLSLTIPKVESTSCDSNGSSPSGSPELSRNSCSPDNASSRVKRGRPQQDIQDEDDPTSQKRRHRRLYARQYRAQMRQRVDEVKVMRSENEELKRLLRENEAEMKRMREELLQKNFVINSLLQTRANF